MTTTTAVLGAIVSGVLFGLLLVLVIIGGGPEHGITGAALLALGSGFVALAVGSQHFTDQQQRWALAPGVASATVGLGVWLLSPGDHLLAVSGWVWPALLLLLVGWSFRGARRALHGWSRQALIYPALLVLSLTAVGGAFETVAEATSSNPPLGGRTYLVDGHRLYLHCIGHRAPTVVLFNGLGERAPSWAWVQQRVSSSARVCSYDRAGEGWSDGTPGGNHLLSDLRGLLQVAHVPGPYVVAGHSVGGVYALLYAARFPKQVSGVVLVDSSSPHQFDLPDYPRFYSLWRRGSALLPSLARVGILRVALSSSMAGLPPQARDAARAFAASPRELRADRVEVAELPRFFDAAKAIASLDGKPLAVVTASVGSQRGWSEAQSNLAKLSTNSTQQTVVGATHTALLEDKAFAAATSRSITRVVRLARSR